LSAVIKDELQMVDLAFNRVTALLCSVVLVVWAYIMLSIVFLPPTVMQNYGNEGGRAHRKKRAPSTETMLAV
jgi:hypothetical protein